MADFNVWTFAASLVGPTIAAFALLHAVKRADAALREWRIQKLGERDADAAVKALHVVLRYVAVIRQVARGHIPPGEESREEKLAAEWSVFDKLDNEFNDTIWLVRAQLGDNEANAIDKIWVIRRGLEVRQGVHLRDSSMYEHAYGKKALEGLEEALTEVHGLLRPHIRMHAAELDPTAKPKNPTILSAVRAWLHEGIEEIERDMRNQPPRPPDNRV